ncbi:MAG TPA: hypothetical protein VEA16_19520 [Vicinamibacterales bacterium]|nr:hypothetical protein [Vicinamibacterales bacterium]
MAPNVATARVTRPDNSPVSTSAGRGARRCFQDAVAANSHVITQKAVGQDVLGRDDEAQFSKMLGGTRPFDLDALDRVPRTVLVDWLRRYGREHGLVVREMDLPELTEQLLTAVDTAASLAKLARVVTKNVKARL